MFILTDSPFPNNPDEIDAELLWGAAFQRMLEADEAEALAGWPVGAFEQDAADAAPESPSPIHTLYVPRPYLGTREIVWGFWLSVDGRSEYADWAMKTWQLVELARQLWEAERQTAAYQYFMPYSDTLALGPAVEA